MSDELQPRLAAYLNSQAKREAFEDMSAADINRMDMGEFARRMGHRTLGEVAQDASVYATPPGRPRQAPAAPAPQQTAPAGLDLTNPDTIKAMSQDDLRRYRAEIHAANGLGSAHANTGSLSGSVARHHLVERNVDRSNAISTRAGTDAAIQAAQQRENERLADYVTSQRARVGHQGVSPVRGTPMGF